MATPVITLAEYRLGLDQVNSDFAKVNQQLKNTETQAQKTGDNIATGVKKGTAAVGDMSTEVGRLERTLQRVGERIVAAFAIESIISFAGSTIKAFEDAELASQKLLFSLNGNQQAFAELSKQAKDIEGKVGIKEADIKSVQAYLAAMGLTTAQIKKVTQVSLDLSSVTGQDLQTTATQLAGTYEGVRGRLSKYSDEVRTMTFAHLEAGGAIDALGDKFKGLSEQIPEATKAMREAEATWTHIKEGIGSFFSGAFVGLMNEFKIMGSGFRDLFTLFGTDGGETSAKALDRVGQAFGGVAGELRELNQASKEAFAIGPAQTVEQLNLALADAKSQRDKLSSSSAEYIKQTEKIQEIEKQLSVITGQKTEAEKKAEEAAKKLAEARKQADTDLVALAGETQKALAAGEEEGLQKKLDILEAERIAVQKKNEERLTRDLEAYKGNTKKQEEIKKAFNDNSVALDNALGEAQDKARKEEADKAITAEGERQKRNKANLDANFKESQEMFVKIGDAKKTIIDKQLAEGQISERDYKEKIRDIDLQTLNDQLKDAERRGEDTVEIKKKIAAEEIQIAKEKKDRIKEIESDIVQNAAQLADSAFSIGEAQRNNEMTALQKKYSDEQTALDEQLKKKQITQKNYDTQKAALDKKAQADENALKAKNDQAAQNESIFKVLIKAAEAIAIDIFEEKYWKIAIDAAASAAQIAIIKATPLPKYAKGTLSVKGGREGEDSVPALLMPGEAVVPTFAAKKYNKALGAMMDGRFDDFVLKSYLPRLLDAENHAKAGSADRMVQSIQLNDRRIVRAIKESKTDTVSLDERSIDKLASRLGGNSTRTSNLYKRYGK